MYCETLIWYKYKTVTRLQYVTSQAFQDTFHSEQGRTSLRDSLWHLNVDSFSNENLPRQKHKRGSAWYTEQTALCLEWRRRVPTGHAPSHKGNASLKVKVCLHVVCKREKDKELLSVLLCVCFHSSTATFRPTRSVHNFWMSISRSRHTHHDRTQVSIIINLYLRTTITQNWSPATLYSSQPLPSVSYIFSKDILRSPDLYFLPSRPPVHNCPLIYMFVMVMNTTLMFILFVNCKVGLLFCFLIAVFEH